MNAKRKLIIGILILICAIEMASIFKPPKENVDHSEKQTLSEITEKQTQSEITITGGDLDLFLPIDEDAIEDSKYADSIELAMKNEEANSDPEQAYMCNMDEIIFQMESDNYVTIYYRSIKDESLECYTMAKFKKKLIEGKTKYVFLTCSYVETELDTWIIGSFESILKSNLELLDFDRDMSVYPGEKRFIYGDTKSEKVFSLKIEGQEPTGIIPYESFGDQWYFWYYEDLQSDKPGSQLEFTVE